ncbi:MAG: glycosyltransferase family 2 protein, partial [Solirubrobacterales bacterium]|nr:glycosyltransferase family 2 protein [Solirubrobacterales bacterium]
LTKSVAAVTSSYEFVFVDDRSVDGAWHVLQRLARDDFHVRAYRLSRNFGQDAAITAGFGQARGRWTVVMDCDLQEAPEEIPRLWAAAGEGYDVVRTIRRGWQHSPFRRWTSRLYRAMLRGGGPRSQYSNMSLLSRRVVDAFLRLRDRDREYTVALNWLGFDSTAIEIDLHQRHAGESGYTLQRLFKVAVDGVFFRTTVLLRVVVASGFLIAGAGVVLAIFQVIDYFAEKQKSVPGYTSLAVLLLVLAGFIIVSIGVVGLYVGRIFEQVKERPLFLIDAEAEGPEVLEAPRLEEAAGGAAPWSAQLSERAARTPSRVPPGSESS